MSVPVSHVLDIYFTFYFDSLIQVFSKYWYGMYVSIYEVANKIPLDEIYEDDTFVIVSVLF